MNAVKLYGEIVKETAEKTKEHDAAVVQTRSFFAMPQKIILFGGAFLAQAKETLFISVGVSGLA